MLSQFRHTPEFLALVANTGIWQNSMQLIRILNLKREDVFEKIITNEKIIFSE